LRAEAHQNLIHLIKDQVPRGTRRRRGCWRLRIRNPFEHDGLNRRREWR